MKKRNIVILGAGISGLSLAWFLQKQHGEQIEITVLEKSGRIGGSIQTIHKEGFLFELGPHSCRSSGAEAATTLELIEELGLHDQVIPASPSARKRYLYTNQRLTALPPPFTCLFSPLMRGVPRALLRDWRTPAGNGEDESVDAFITRRFGAEIAEQFIDPMTSGIYAGDMRQLSIQSCFPQLFHWEQESGSVIKGMFKSKKKPIQAASPFIQQMQKQAMFSFKSGMEVLPKALEKHLKQKVTTSCSVKAIHLHPDNITLELDNGTKIQTNHLFSTLPAQQVSELIKPHHPDLAQMLSSMCRTSVAVVNLGYRRPLLPVQGFGYLIPTKENEEILGVIWDSCVFPQQNLETNQTRLTVMLGGAHKPHLCTLPEDEILEIALRRVAKQLGIYALPDVSHVSIAHNAIPQYHVGHNAKVSCIMQKIGHLSPYLTCLGNSFYGVSLNECFAKARVLSSPGVHFRLH